jgi:microsomal dipeptidase-like Zn-dependent dipeptidase
MRDDENVRRERAERVTADLHLHYPMHVMGQSGSTLSRMIVARGRPSLADRVRAVILRIASRVGSDRDWWSGYRVSAEGMRQGGVRLALSVLYSPFEEMDFTRRYGSPPMPDYFARLLSQLDAVEQEVASHGAQRITISHDADELEDALQAGMVTLVHCVEGGFHLGSTPGEVDRNVAELARRGVAYVTLAHLFYRGVATNSPALPFLPDWAYDWLFRQPRGEGLTELGEAAVRAAVRERVLLDISHMRAEALVETFALLDQLDPSMPVLATHAGYRFGEQHYMLDSATVEQIARRQGVIGLIMAQHQPNDGIRSSTTTFEESFEVICRHVDRIREITQSHRHVAIGSDLDGFIKPTMAGVETVADLGRLAEALHGRYGRKDAELITSGNALRVLRAVWGRGALSQPAELS